MHTGNEIRLGKRSGSHLDMETMPTAEDCAKVAKLVDSLANKHFGDEVRIVRIEVKGDSDPEFGQEMWIRIVVASPGGAPLSADANILFRRELHDELRKQEIAAYPVLTFSLYAEIGDAA